MTSHDVFLPSTSKMHMAKQAGLCEYLSSETEGRRAGCSQMEAVQFACQH